jgi:hypothetical protein
MGIGFMSGPKSIAKVKAPDRIPFQEFKTHRQTKFVSVRQRVFENT